MRRTIQKTPTQFIIRYLPIRAWLFGGALFATFALLGAVLSGAFAAGTVSTLECHRRDRMMGECILKDIQQPLYADKTEQIYNLPLTQVSSANVTQKVQDNQPVYTITLQTQSGKLDFNAVQASDRAAQQAVQQINQFLKTPQAQSLNITYRYNTMTVGDSLYFGLRFLGFLLPGCVLLLSPGMILKLDKTTERITVIQWGLLQKWRIETFPLSYIWKVQCQENSFLVASDNDQIVHPSNAINPQWSNVLIALTIGEEIALPASIYVDQERQLAQELRAFLEKSG